MLDLFGNAKCWFSHAKAHMNKAFQKFLTLFYSFTSRATSFVSCRYRVTGDYCILHKNTTLSRRVCWRSGSCSISDSDSRDPGFNPHRWHGNWHRVVSLCKAHEPTRITR